MQDLASSAMPKELNTEKVECDAHQGNKVGSSAVGESTRSKERMKLLLISAVFILQCLH